MRTWIPQRLNAQGQRRSITGLGLKPKPLFLRPVIPPNPPKTYYQYKFNQEEGH